MALVVEDGSGVSGAEAYGSTSVIADYATKQGLAWDPASEPAAEAAARVASRWLDSAYRGRYPGYRRNGRAQGLEWPRSGAFVSSPDATSYGFETLPNNEVPREIVQAFCEAAIREAASPGTLSPDLDAGMVIQSVQADTVSVNFGGGGLAVGVKAFQTIDSILSSLLAAPDPYGGRLGRC